MADDLPGLEAVDYNPWSPTFHSVEHDPFSTAISATDPSAARLLVPQQTEQGYPYWQASSVIRPTPNAPTMTPYERLKWNEREIERSQQGPGNKTEDYLPPPARETPVSYDPYADVMRATGMSPAHVRALREGVTDIESRGSGLYGAQDPGNSNFGRYQYNMRDVAEIAHNVYGEQPPNYFQLMRDPALQEKYYAGYLMNAHDWLSRSPAYMAASPAQKAHILAMAQFGPGNALRAFLGDASFRDANGTPIGNFRSAVNRYLPTEEGGGGAEVDEAQAAREVAAARMRRAVQPAGGRTPGFGTALLSRFLDPEAVLRRQLTTPMAGVNLARGLMESAATFPQRYGQMSEGVARGEDTGIGPANLELYGYMTGSRGPFAKPGELGAGGGGRLTTPGEPVATLLQADAAAAPVKMVPVNYDPYAWTGAQASKMVERGPEDFHAAIREAKAAHPEGAAVTLYSPEDYGNMRTWTGPGGDAGVAVTNDGDIVSVFKHPESPMRNASATLLSHALQMGGNRLDAFDTVLPDLYGREGMRAVARIPFDPKHAPEGWNYETFKHYNNGRPDVVFMVHDPFNPGYKPGDGVMAGSYDEAVALQKRAVADIEQRKQASRESFDKAASQITGLKGVQQYLTEPELERITKRNGQKLVDIFSQMPSGEEMAATAFSGRAKRGWYADSAKALVDIFGANDSRRFAGLLAALSPQNSVEMNAINTLRSWNEWIKAGRPTDLAGINRALNEGMGGASSVLPAWRGNAIRILRADDPATVQLSGPKVNSFMENLRGRVHEVTNDAWMANYANLDQQVVSAARVKDVGEPIPGAEPKIGVKSPGYLAFSAAVRRAAQTLSQKTGQVWTPAEIQETIWSWAKTLQEKAASAASGKDATVEKLLKAGGITHAEIGNTPDFARLFTSGVYRKVLEEGGYGKQLGQIERAGGRGRQAPSGSPTSAEGSGFTQPAFEGYLRSSGRRLDERAARGLSLDTSE